MATFQNFKAKVTRSIPLSEFTRHLELEVEGVSKFGFVPGQWLSVRAVDPKGEEFTRAYSIASPPGANGHVAFCLNRVQEGFMSNYLCDLAEGSEVNFQGPFGDFILRPPLHDTLFIATGTGVAPFRSMLHWLLADPERHHQRQLWLLLGARTEQDLYYRDEFARLSAQHDNFHFLPTLSRGDQAWTGLRGYVQDHVPSIISTPTGTRTDMHAYICGLEKMVKANRTLLKSLGWDRTSIRYEKYD